ncbi:MAG: 2-hydroxyacyl-CoA dehydratase [Clostridiales Family XIII bacterium]|jgi:benzoyl-CoA reductase subunit C|nr:2-hydroxyacyl-CoA dehydratase [Clostridiales Family XIII bacterium]
MDRFRNILENRHDYAREWKKRTGGRVLGYYETYMPEEVAYAAGALPVRIMAGHRADDVTDRQMYGNCYCTRDMLRQFLEGDYDYVDGVVNTEGCQWMYNAFQTAVNRRPGLFSHYIFVPDYTDGRTSKDVLKSELGVFRGRLEEWTGSAITDGALDAAIDVYNENRRLLRRIYELRRLDRPAILGSEAMGLLLASQIMDKAEMNVMLRELIPEIERRAPAEDGVRLMLIGSETYDVELERIVESAGGNVVVDELDNGSSYIWNETIPMQDRLMALALRYLGRPHSALKDNVWRRRPQRIYELYEDFHADGVVIAKQIYCHPHGSDMYAVWKMLRERNIPYHTFERDTTLPPSETRQRIEALIGMIKPGMTRLRGWSEA